MRRFVLGNPLLDDDTSVVVLDAEERIVSLSWLLVDHVRRRAENEWTATLPSLRGRLARLAKYRSDSRRRFPRSAIPSLQLLLELMQ
jgi:hypothetical protein